MHVASYYNILKITPDAPTDVIRAAYRALAARNHPDRCTDDPGALQRMQRITEAYRVLVDPQLRAGHDATLGRQRRRRASDSQPAEVSPSPAALAYPVAVAAPASPPSRRQRAVAEYAAHLAGPRPRPVTARA